MPSAGTVEAARLPKSEKEQEPVTVLVTGFGPFLDKFPINTSWSIASTLPALLPAEPTTNTPPVRILVHHAPIRVAYQTVPPLVPALISPPASSTSLPVPNIVLHIGLAAGRRYYTLEHGAHSRGYGSIPDVDGERFSDSTAESKWPSKSYPSVLKTGFRIKDAWRRWRARLNLDDPEFDVRMSEDAGNFMCGFIYWNSLVHYWEKEAKREDGQKSRGRPVAFLHVPDLSTEEALSKGREVTVQLIKALVESFLEVGLKDDDMQSQEKDRVSGFEGDGETAKMDVNFVA